MEDSGGNHFDVIVAGVGSMGSAACYHLADRAVRVLGLEQFSIPHANGSHHGRSRMIRKAYFEHPDYVPLLHRAYDLWDRLQGEAEFEDQFFYRTGGLYVGSEAGTIVPGSLRAAEQHGLSFSKLDPGGVADRFPQFAIDPAHVAFFEDDGGFLVPESAVAAHAEMASRAGAELHPNEPLTSYQTHQTGVTVTTALRKYTADHLILTSGAWTSEVARELGISLEVTRQVLAWFRPTGDPARFAPENFPCWFVESDPPYGHYGFPIRPGDPGLKIAIHKPGEPIDPDNLRSQNYAPTDEEIDGLRSVLNRYLPGSAGDLTEACTCLYTNSPDHHFILGAHPGQQNATIACGFSGHGFKFSTVIGEALADLATAGTSELPIGFLTPERFL